MNARLCTVLLLLLIAQPDQRYFRYERQLRMPPQQKVPQTCAVIDPAIYAHAAPQLADLRLYQNAREVAYVLAANSSTIAAYPRNELLNLGLRNGTVVFDVKMPGGPYSDVWLNIHPAVQNFVLSVDVSGKENPSSPDATRLGSYTIFDLTQQKLGRSTVLHLPTSTFAYLHFSIEGALRPSAVESLTYATATDASPQTVVVAETSRIAQLGRTSVITFDVPANVPVDSIAFVPAASSGNFHRQVDVKVESADKQPNSSPETVSTFDILRYHGLQNGKRIDEENLNQGVFGRPGATRWTVTIQNGDDPPIVLDSVKLEMFARRMCFDAAMGTAYSLYYGDQALSAPQYDYASLFHADREAAQAMFGPEQAISRFVPRPDERPFTERHPALLWIALVIAVAVLGGVALRTARQTRAQ
jgi:Protein of unknown function (DUF3999)